MKKQISKPTKIDDTETKKLAEEMVIITSSMQQVLEDHSIRMKEIIGSVEQLHDILESELRRLEKLIVEKNCVSSRSSSCE